MRMFRQLLVSVFLPCALLVGPPSVAATLPTLTVVANAPEAGSIPQGAQRVDFLTLRLAASCDAPVRLESVTLRHWGLGASADIESLALWNGSVRVSPSVSPDRKTGDVTLRPRRLEIPACQTLVLVARARIAEDAAPGGEHGYALHSADDLRTASPVRVTITSPQTPAPGSVAPSVDRNAQIAVTMLPVTGSVTYGAGRTVARFQIKAEGSSTQRMTRLTLTNQGSAKDADLRNLVLLNGKNEPVSEILPKLTGDTATFVFDPPIDFEGSETRLFKVRADVRASRKRTIDFMVEDPSDVETQVCPGARSCAQAY